MNEYIGNIEPGKNIVFVFGSNPEGRHGAGSAKVALRLFGAEYGNGRGMQGDSYALVTTELRRGFPRITLEQITENVRELYKTAKSHPDKKFMVAYRSLEDERTLCGYTGGELVQCFLDAGDVPKNIWFSQEWCKIIKNKKK